MFLGSPGDLEAERKAAKIIVDEENANHANELGYQIDLVGWEDTVSQRKRAQEAINLDLDQCEYFVGLMFKKWGTPPGLENHPYTSGFEEEYCRSIDRYEKSGKPEISLLFKNISEDDLKDPGPQLQKVLEFQEGINSGKQQYYQRFDEVRDFEQKFRAIIAKFLKDQHKEDQELESSDPQKPTGKKNISSQGRELGPSKRIFENEALEFLNEFLDKGDDAETYTAADAARFRLLACSVSQQGNDRLVLGVHDANLIYRYLRKKNLSQLEERSLISSALESLDFLTVPVWHWVFKTDIDICDELPFRTFYGSDKSKRNAFRLLELLSLAPKDFTGTIEKNTYPRIWFGEDVSDDLTVRALEYLGAMGDDEIEVDWPTLIGNSEANRSSAAVRAKARIVARSSTNEALRFIANHENVELDKQLIEEVLANIKTTETKILSECLKNKSIMLVKRIAIELSSRDALTNTEVQSICNNSNAEIRLIGVGALAKIRPDLSLVDAHRILVKPREKNALGLFTQGQNRDFPGENAFEKHKINVFKKLPYNKLMDLKKEESFYSSEASLAIYFSHFKKIRAQLQHDLLDGFEEYFERKYDLIADTSGQPSKAVYNFVKHEFLQSAFEAFCSKANKQDIGVVRQILDNNEVKFSDEITGYLAKNGDWSDIKRIIKTSRNLKHGFAASLLSLVDHSSSYQLAAEAILKLSSNRIPDVLQLELPTPIKIKLFLKMPKKLFSKFSDQSLVDMLADKEDLVREVIALKSVLCLTKKRLIKILDAYYHVDGTHYYNAIFWLDLGISADRSLSVSIAQKELGTK